MILVYFRDFSPYTLILLERNRFAMSQKIDIFNNLHYRLVSGEFEHGAKLRADVLRDEFECSASTVREALFRLSTVGLVDFHEQRGFRVPIKSSRKIIELTHIRILLECEGAAMSIRNGGVRWEAKMTAAHHQLSHIETRIQGTGDTSVYVGIWNGAEREFHQTLIAACESETLKEMHARVYAQFRQQLMISDRHFAFISENIQQHAQIVEAAISGDEVLTRQKIHDHLARHLTGAT